MKRFWGLIAAAGLLGAAAAATNAIDASRDHAQREDAQRAAEAAGQRASDGLGAHVAELKLKVQNAAANPRLQAALQGNVDAATLQDLFRTETWWQPIRDEFKVYAIALDGDKLDILEGMRAADFAGEAMVRSARGRREPIAEIVMGKGWPYAAAATVAPVAERAVAPVLVLAKPIDEAAVRSLADKARERGAAQRREGAGAGERRRWRARALAPRGRLGDQGAALRRARRELGGGREPGGARPVDVELRRRRPRHRRLGRDAEVRDLGRGRARGGHRALSSRFGRRPRRRWAPTRA